MTIEKPDILYYMLQCLNVMCLYGDAFNTAVKDHQGFFIWCQENLLIKKYVLEVFPAEVTSNGKTRELAFISFSIV